MDTIVVDSVEEAIERMYGLPTVTLVHDVFERAAKLQAEALGRPELPMAVFPQGPPEQTDAEVDRLANLAFERILARLAGA